MKKPTKTTVRTPIKDLKEKETIEHYNAVLLEDIKSKMEFVIEGMESTKQSLKNDMNNLQENMTQEMELMKGVMHKYTEDLDIRSLWINNLKNNVKETNLQIVQTNEKIDKFRAELTTTIGTSGTELSAKIDKIGEKIDDNDTRITTLETAHP